MVITTKACSTCKTEQPRANYHRNRGNADGLDPRCRSCRVAATATHVTDHGRKRSAANLRTYGLTSDQYDQLHDAQNGLCAICSQPETMTYRGRTKALSIDHDHNTGQVRGLLCASCNFALGKFYDDPHRLRAAADYLER